MDLGSIFDLLTLRPVESLSAIPGPTGDFAQGVDTTVDLNVHSIALQIKKTLLTADGSNPTNVLDKKSVIGVWAAASRQEVSINNVEGGSPTLSGPWKQVSRLGNPLINELFIFLGQKDYWNTQQPHNDKQFLQYLPESPGCGSDASPVSHRPATADGHYRSSKRTNEPENRS